MFSLAVIAGVAGVLSLDSVGALAARQGSWRYAMLAPVSHAIWLLTGALAGWTQRTDLLLAIASGAVAALLVGTVDATLGWWISTKLGATPMANGQTWELRIRRVSPRVVMRATIAGALGGLISGIA